MTRSIPISQSSRACRWQGPWDGIGAPVELGDLRRPTPEHRALIDRALVGDLGGIERGQLREQDAAATRFELPVARLGETRPSSVLEIAAHALVGAIRAPRGPGRQAELPGPGRRRDRETPAARMSPWSAPAIATSLRRGRKCASSRARSGPTLTQVPVASLKSSAMRP